MQPLLALQITQVMQQAEKRLEERLAGPAMALLDGAAENMWPRLQHLLASCSGEASKVRLYCAGYACWRTLGPHFHHPSLPPLSCRGGSQGCALQCAPISSAEAKSLGTFVPLQECQSCSCSVSPGPMSAGSGRGAGRLRHHPCRGKKPECQAQGCWPWEAAVPCL